MQCSFLSHQGSPALFYTLHRSSGFILLHSQWFTCLIPSPLTTVKEKACFTSCPPSYFKNMPYLFSSVSLSVLLLSFLFFLAMPVCVEAGKWRGWGGGSGVREAGSRHRRHGDLSCHRCRGKPRTPLGLGARAVPRRWPGGRCEAPPQAPPAGEPALPPVPVDSGCPRA